jgi:hypothetical protein
MRAAVGNLAQAQQAQHDDAAFTYLRIERENRYYPGEIMTSDPAICAARYVVPLILRRPARAEHPPE